MLSIELIKKISPAPKARMQRFEVGQTVRVHQKIKEGDKERVQIYEGLIISMNSGYGVNATMTVRKVVDGIGVEKIFPIFSPLLEKVEITKKSKVRRAKLYYMRKLSGKSARLKSKFISNEESEKYLEEAVVVAKAKEEAAEEGETVAVEEIPETVEVAATEEASKPEEESKA